MAPRLVLTVAMLAGLFEAKHIFDDDLKTCPQYRDEQTGNIYPLENHGRTVYLTMQERKELWEASGLMFAPIVGMFSLGIWASRPEPWNILQE